MFTGHSTAVEICIQLKKKPRIIAPRMNSKNNDATIKACENEFKNVCLIFTNWKQKKNKQKKDLRRNFREWLAQRAQVFKLHSTNHQSKWEQSFLVVKLLCFLDLSLYVDQQKSYDLITILASMCQKDI